MKCKSQRLLVSLMKKRLDCLTYDETRLLQELTRRRLADIDAEVKHRLEYASLPFITIITMRRKPYDNLKS